MEKSNLIDLVPSIEEKQMGDFLIKIAEEIFGSYISTKLINWKFNGKPLQPEDNILMKLSGWKKTLFAISDIAANQIGTSSSLMNMMEIQWKSESVKSFRGIFWAMIKLNYFLDVELQARSSEGEVFLIEDSNHRGKSCQ